MILTVRNWSDFQHYKDRSPPWIRLHRDLLDNYEFQCLPVASRALAPMLWLIAAGSEDLKEPKIDATPAKLAFRLRMPESDVVTALKPLIDAGFFVVAQDASGVLATSKQVAVPEAEAEAEAEERRESPAGDPPTPAEPKAKKPKREKRPDLTFDQWLATIPDDADIVPADDPLWSWWDTQRLPFEWRPLAWAAFEQKYTGKPKRYADWLAVFRSAVREDWLHVWRSLPDGSNVLTTVGEQLRRAA